MYKRRIAPILYFLAFFVIIAACDFEGGRIHELGSVSFVNWNWAQILIILGIGFLIGSVVTRRKV
jgi:hypothetical protein